MPNGSWTLTGNAGINPTVDFIGTTDNEPLVLKTSATERLRVDASGNVGIGTANPNFTLDVKSSGRIKLGLEGNGGGQLQIANNPNDNTIYLEAFNTAGNASASQLLLTGADGQNVPQLSLLANSTLISGLQTMISLAGNGGGQLRFGNNPNDNKIFLEAYNTAGNGSASELLLTGYAGQNVPLLTLLATTTVISGNATVSGTLTATTIDSSTITNLQNRINTLTTQVNNLQQQLTNLQQKESQDVQGLSTSIITLAERVTALGG